MFCWNCGKEIDDQAIFCPHCGMKQAGTPQPAKKKKTGFLIPVICAAVCVGALLGMLLLLAGTGNSPEPQLQVTVPTATEAASKPEATEEKTASKVNPNSAELPDLEAFLDTEYTQDEWGYTHYVTCLVDDGDAVNAVLDLLLEPRYQLKLMDKDSNSDGTHYTYEYTGTNENIDWVYLKAGGQYHVKLTVKPYGSSQTAIIMYSFPEFYLEDPGKQWEGTDTPSPNHDDPDPTKEPYDPFTCKRCNNTRRCPSCNGRKGQWKYVPGMVGEKYFDECTTCWGSGSCPSC